jgi:hypothetical protein
VKNVMPMIVVSGLLVLLVQLFAAYNVFGIAAMMDRVYMSRPATSLDSMPSPAEIRGELIARCVAKPDMIAEIERMLPDNDDSQITPAILRAVFKDVVTHC